MKTRGRISGQTILLDTLPGLPMDQRVEVDITPVEDTAEIAEARNDEADTHEPAQKRRRGTTLSDLLSELGITREELDARVEADPSIREARKHRKKLEQLMGGHKIDVAQLIREDRDR
ncbi:MAG: hypothetical protein F4Y49_15905 [Dehalococcoidia bacterium]|nr:hypothetical protein [Dehalococcoidia bacterium]